MSTAVEGINLGVFRRYAGLSLPRHVSYPMPTGWQDLGPEEATAMQRESRERTPAADLSLYLHVPFCERSCRYCACTRTVLPKQAPQAKRRIQEYVEALQREIRMLGGSLGAGRLLRQIHWGGGTPTSLSTDNLQRVQDTVRRVFSVSPDAEIAIELDPRVTTSRMLGELRRLGFNRLSLGVQDFNQRVQEHVRRIQPFEMVRDLVAACRRLGFGSINFDLIYGLPYQTPSTVQETVEKTIELSPDRIAFYHYAQIPEKIAAQRGLDHTRLPSSESKLEMFLLGLQVFEAAGYKFIGLDHFAKPTEALARASEEGALQRNFQGMTTGAGLDLIGIGATSIGHLAGIGYLQNLHDAGEYAACVNDGRSPVHRGKRFSFEDRVRQAVINRLYCQARVRPAEIERQFDIVFSDYFSRELQIMNELERDGLVTLEPDGVIQVTQPLGRVLMRNVAAVFDAYLEPDAYRVGDRRCFSANA